jgi:hypothetical protein
LEPLARRLDAVSAEIADMTPREDSAADEIRRRREARRAKGVPVARSHG